MHLVAQAEEMRAYFTNRSCHKPPHQQLRAVPIHHGANDQEDDHAKLPDRIAECRQKEALVTIQQHVRGGTQREADHRRRHGADALGGQLILVG